MAIPCVSSDAFKGESTTYQTFTVMRESEIIATDDSGRELILNLYGSAMLKDGRYKLYSFVVDEFPPNGRVTSM